MAGRAGNRILLIAMILLSSVSFCFAESGQDTEATWGWSGSENLYLNSFEADSLKLDQSLGNTAIQLQEGTHTWLSEINELLEPDFYLGISYNNRSLNRTFLESNSILIKEGFEDQYLFTIDITSAVIILDQLAMELTYSSIPVQRNFPNSSVLNFESERIILNEVNRYNGRVMAFSTAYFVPIVEGIRAAIHVGIANMKLNIEETMQYHPDDPFARDYTITTLPFRKREVTYSNPFAGFSAEFQLRNVRLSTGYQIQLYQLEEVSSTNFYISLGVRLRDLF